MSESNKNISPTTEQRRQEQKPADAQPSHKDPTQVPMAETSGTAKSVSEELQKPQPVDAEVEPPDLSSDDRSKKISERLEALGYEKQKQPKSPGSAAGGHVFLVLLKQGEDTEIPVRVSEKGTFLTVKGLEKGDVIGWYEVPTKWAESVTRNTNVPTSFTS